MAAILHDATDSYRVELLLIIVCACAPTLIPLYERTKRYSYSKRSTRSDLETSPTYDPVESDHNMISHPLEAIYLKDARLYVDSTGHDDSTNLSV